MGRRKVARMVGYVEYQWADHWENMMEHCWADQWVESRAAQMVDYWVDRLVAMLVATMGCSWVDPMDCRWVYYLVGR